MLGFYGGTGGGKGGRGKGGVEGTGGNCGRGGEGARGQRPANQDAGGRPKSLPKPSVSLRVVAFSCLLPPGAWACKQPAPRKPRSRRPPKLITKNFRSVACGCFFLLAASGCVGVQAASALKTRIQEAAQTHYRKLSFRRLWLRFPACCLRVRGRASSERLENQDPGGRRWATKKNIVFEQVLGARLEQETRSDYFLKILWSSACTFIAWNQHNLNLVSCLPDSGWHETQV